MTQDATNERGMRPKAKRRQVDQPLHGADGSTGMPWDYGGGAGDRPAGMAGASEGAGLRQLGVEGGPDSAADVHDDDDALEAELEAVLEYIIAVHGEAGVDRILMVVGETLRRRRVRRTRVR